jgi:hypothetical protein
MTGMKFSYHLIRRSSYLAFRRKPDAFPFLTTARWGSGNGLIDAGGQTGAAMLDPIGLEVIGSIEGIAGPSTSSPAFCFRSSPVLSDKSALTW